MRFLKRVFNIENKRDLARPSAPASLAPPPPNLKTEFVSAMGTEAANEPKAVGHIFSAPVSHAGAKDEDRHIATFAGVPPFIRRLTDGEQPVVSLSKSDLERVAVLEVSSQSALLAHCGVEQALLESVKGRLIGRGYQIHVHTADPDVIEKIQRAGGGTSAVVSATDANNQYALAAHDWIAYGVKVGATDAHLETAGQRGQVRYRVNGELELMRTPNNGQFTAEFVQAVSSYMFGTLHETKSNSGSSFHQDKNAYCMVPYDKVPGSKLKLRFQSLKGVYGPKTVLRFLDVDDEKPTLTFEQLGFEDSHIRLLKQAQRRTNGFVITAGETGGGKTTTIKSFIELNPRAPRLCIISLEDPSEYRLKHVHQVYLQRDMADLASSKAAMTEQTTAFVRSDPDIIIMNEVRDYYSANASQQFSLTGHMAVCSVHAHGLSGIVPRLIDPEIGLTRSVLTGPGQLSLLIYQDVVAKLCPHCALRAKQVADDEEVTLIVRNLKALGYDVSPMRWRNPAGCERCSSRGTSGLTAVAEMFSPDDEWLNAVRECNDTLAHHIYCSRSDNDLTSGDMTGKTAFEHVLLKALRGVVDATACFKYGDWDRYMARKPSRERIAKHGAEE
jgi:general secretion pathway protein E